MYTERGNTMDLQKKIELLADMFEVEEDELSPEMKLIDMDCWDSMAKLSLIVLIEDECGKKLSADVIKGFETLQDILDYMG